ncbi:MAG: 50S ribosomal protein L16 [Candidatus Micrarchaeia archaeon]
MKIRPGRSVRNIDATQPWTRYSIRKPRKNYIKALPRTSLLIFNMGTNKPEYDLELSLVSKQDIQLRSNALEAARQVANKYLEKELPGNYYFYVVTYPHHVLREKRFATAAGADRLSQGMSMTFGKPVGVAARVKEGTKVFVLRTFSANRKKAKIALERAIKKLSGKYAIHIEELKPNPSQQASQILPSESNEVAG